jgi:hypothetical protein
MSGPEKSRAPRQSPPDPKDREARLKAALQANIARRKALERARAEAAARSAPAGDGEGG